MWKYVVGSNCFVDVLIIDTCLTLTYMTLEFLTMLEYEHFIEIHAYFCPHDQTRSSQPAQTAGKYQKLRAEQK